VADKLSISEKLQFSNLMVESLAVITDPLRLETKSKLHPVKEAEDRILKKKGKEGRRKNRHKEKTEGKKEKKEE
jgi:hypothetical protein